MEPAVYPPPFPKLIVHFKVQTIKYHTKAWTRDVIVIKDSSTKGNPKRTKVVGGHTVT